MQKNELMGISGESMLLMKKALKFFPKGLPTKGIMMMMVTM